MDYNQTLNLPKNRFFPMRAGFCSKREPEFLGTLGS